MTPIVQGMEIHGFNMSLHQKGLIWSCPKKIGWDQAGEWLLLPLTLTVTKPFGGKGLVEGMKKREKEESLEFEVDQVVKSWGLT